MAAPLLNFQMKKFSLLRNNMQRRLNNLQDRRAVNLMAIVVIDRWVQENFRGEGKKATGSGWKPLSPRTEYQKRHRKSAPTANPKILQDRGWLRMKWKHFADRRTATLQSGVPYGRPHDEGVGVPKRPIIPTKEQARPLIREVYQHWLKRTLK